jgi:hypothetical protein
MKYSSIHRFILNSIYLLLSSLLIIGCGEKHKDEDNHDHGNAPAVEKTAAESKESGGAHDDHGAETAGATYQEGKGISLLEETKKSLGLELAEVGEQSVWPMVKLTAQVYRSAAEPSKIYGPERQGYAYATALISKETVTQLKSGQKLSFAPKDSQDSNHEGIIQRIDMAQIPVLGKAEALLQLPDTDHSLTVGAFIEAQVPIGQAPQKLISIPRSALLETSTGTYAFVQNGSFLLRTEVKTGAQNNEYIEITEGLYEGDTIAVKPVETLYLIELRSTKGGGHCH